MQKEFKIPKENILCVGDETDLYFASLFKRDVSINYSAAQEIDDVRRKLKAWYRAFPTMRLCSSNHGDRILKKAFDCELPSQVLKAYRDIIEAPAGWKWQDEWIIKTKSPFRMIHGHGYGGMSGARNAAIDSKISTVLGHIHSHASVWWIHTRGQDRPIWSMNTGSLIEEESFAFNYSRLNRHKAIISLGVVLNDGQLPILIPYGSI